MKTLYIESEIPLSVGMKPEDGEIVDVGPYRHRVKWTAANGGGLSQLTYCNGCGCPFVEEAYMKELEGMPIERTFNICPGCGSFHGWVDDGPQETRH